MNAVRKGLCERADDWMLVYRPPAGRPCLARTRDAPRAHVRSLHHVHGGPRNARPSTSNGEPPDFDHAEAR